MAIAHKVVRDLLVIRANGVLDLADVESALRDASSDPEIEAVAGLLIDDLGTTFSPSSQDLQRFAGLLEGLLAGKVPRVALIVRREIHYGFGRMVEVYCEAGSVKFRVFRSRPEAEAWLRQARGSTEGSFADSISE
jgi:hypothetical protein